MKKIVFVLTTGILLSACSSEQEKVNTETIEAKTTDVVVNPNQLLTMEIDGMVCKMGCGGAIRKGLKGTKRWLETHAVPMRNELGAIISILAVTRDITERTTIEKEKNSLLLTLENSLNEIYIFDAETYKFSFVNKGALHNLGYLESEIKTLTPFDINSDIKLDSFNELVSPLLKGEKEKITLITNHKRKDGSVYPVEVHLQLVIEDKAKGISKPIESEPVKKETVKKVPSTTKKTTAKKKTATKKATTKK